MKWINHKMLTAVGVYAITPTAPLYIIPAILGSVFPDIIEGKPPIDKNSSEYQRWRRNHRQLSHWVVLYLLPILVLYLSLYYIPVAHPSILSLFGNEHGFKVFINIIIFFFVGCIMHIVQDAVCGKVPSINPNRRIGIKLFKVGSFTEYLIVYSIVFLIVFKFLTNFIGGNH